MTKVYRIPSSSVIIWLLVPKVVGPPAWLVLTVSLVLVNWPLAPITGVLPVAMMDASAMRPLASIVGLPVVNIRNRFWPDGAPSSTKDVS